MRIVLLLVSLLVACPVVVHAVAVYVSSAQVLIRSEQFSPADEEAKKWRLVQSAETIVLNMTEFKDLVYASIKQIQEEGNPMVSSYASGLLVTTRGVQDPDLTRGSSRDREIQIQVEIRNTNGTEKVYVSDKKFAVIDDHENELSVVPCRKRPSKKASVPFVMPGEQLSLAVCVEVSGSTDPHRLRLRFYDGNEEGNWMTLRAPVRQPEK